MSLYPAVSVIIPTYNRADLLREAVGSVLVQSAPPHEIVVVDDGSTDHTPVTARELARAGAATPIIYLREEHGDRLGELRNRGVAASSGELIAFLDSDDLWQPTRLELALAAWNKMPAALFSFCNVQRFDSQGPFPEGPWLPAHADFTGDVLGALLEEAVAVPSALIVRREAFVELGGFSARPINEDYELTLRLAERGPASYVPQPLVWMRANPGSRSQVRNEEALSEYAAIVRDFLAERPHLPAAIRARGKLGLANAHYKLAMLLLTRGDRWAARRHFATFWRLRPLDRRALAALPKLLLPSRH